MRKTERNIIIGLLVIIYLIIVGDNFKQNTFIQNSIAVACSVIAPILVYFVDSILSNITRIEFWFLSKLRFRRHIIRVSMSYQYRIHVNDKYLLVKNSTWDFYQHVGGVYKVLSGDEGFLKDTFKWERDKKMKTSGEKHNDLRGFIPILNLIRFLDWFKTQKNREVSHWREFCEELIIPGILDFKIFPHIEYRYVGTVLTPIKRSEKWNCLEILSYDVFDIIPNEKQFFALSETQKTESELYKWVDEPLIQSLGYNERDKKDELKIGHHTKWIINLKYSKT
jgi:hypothetical protein